MNNHYLFSFYPSIIDKSYQILQTNEYFLGGSVLELEPQVEDLLSILKNEVHNRKNKNVEVLQLAENITRRMNGNFKQHLKDIENNQVLKVYTRPI